MSSSSLQADIRNIKSIPKEWFENLGESYLAYFRRKRMEKAAELLEATTLKVIEIANAVGYENQGKFAKVFSEVYGMTPLEYRRWAR